MSRTDHKFIQIQNDHSVEEKYIFIEHDSAAYNNFTFSRRTIFNNFAECETDDNHHIIASPLLLSGADAEGQISIVHTPLL